MKDSIGIAIVGIGGIFPDAPDLSAFWSNIREGISASREIPRHRWAVPIDRAYSPFPPKPDKAYSRRGCLIEERDLDLFLDRYSQDISAYERERLDPLYLMTMAAGIMAWRDGVTENLDLSRAGIILGNIALPTEKSSALAWEILGRTFEEKLLGKSISLPAKKTDPLNGFVTGLPAGLLARALKLGGGCYTIDAACASSLYAINLAVNELRSGRSDAMLCGGVSRPDCLYTQTGFSQLNALSPDGICAPFDRKGKGLVIGEGAGIILIKRLDDAIRAGDRIYGIIRAIGLSNDIDGSLLAPSSEGQLRSMRHAYEEAQWTPQDVDIIECHAAGTPVGDAIEFESLNQLWQGAPWRKGQCVIGSVKSNVGHLLTGAGAAGLIKILLALREKTLPPTANFSHPAPSLHFEDSPFRVLSEAEPWEMREKSISRKAAISAFGFGGINAHALIEEFRVREKSKIYAQPRKRASDHDEAIAVIGMDACYGPWSTIDEFYKRAVDSGDSLKASPKTHWFGVEDSTWFKEQQKAPGGFEGFGIDDLTVPLGTFRIPPREMQEMLPQQLLMLLVASRALEDAGVKAEDHTGSGIFIGIGFDFSTTNFHVRWSVLNKVREWARAMNLSLSQHEQEEWANMLCDAVSPPLTANRTMGALGSIVASRIAREFRFGGPSFTLSSEESSGLKALETAVQKLRQGDIDCALVGSVDLAADIRMLMIRKAINGGHQLKEAAPGREEARSTPFGEGASAVVLKKLADAERDGNRIYCVIRGTGSATGADRHGCAPEAETYLMALERAYGNAEISPDSVDFLEIDGAGRPDGGSAEGEALMSFFGRGERMFPRALGCVRSQIGDSGAAGSLASFVRASLCVFNNQLPLQKNRELLNEGLSRRKDLFSIPHHTSHWLRNRIENPRRAGVSSTSIDGNCIHVVLESYEKNCEQPVSLSTPRLRSGFREGLFSAAGGSLDALLERLGELRKFARESSGESIESLAMRWHHQNPIRQGRGRAIACISKTGGELIRQIESAMTALDRMSEKQFHGRDRQLLPDIAPDSIFYTPLPLAREGKIAFVFPGSGNCYPGMGQELSRAFPEILELQDRENASLKQQILPEYFWNSDSLDVLKDDHRSLMTGQVAFCTIASDILRSLEILPEAVIGNSLGEMAGLFSLRAWTDRELMMKRMQESRLFTDYLAGPCRAARKWWKLPTGEKVEWSLGVVDVSPQQVREAISGKSRVYLLIINTDQDCVVGGDRKAVERLVDELDCTFLPVEGVSTVHCEVVKAVGHQYRGFHLFPTTAPPGITFYSTGWGRGYELTRENAADAILAQAIDTLDFPRVIKAAYDDGVRVFIESGPGSSCTRMINTILENLPHAARSMSVQGINEGSSLLRLAGHLIAEGVPLNLDRIYGAKSAIPVQDASRTMTLMVGGAPYEIPAGPEKGSIEIPAAPIQPQKRMPEKVALPSGMTVEPVMTQFESIQNAKLGAHEAYLSLSDTLAESMSRNVSFQLTLLEHARSRGFEPGPAGVLTLPARTATEPLPRDVEQPPQRLKSDGRQAGGPQRQLNRSQCMEFAVGAVARVLGPLYEEIDHFPTRVRLPDEPLMLVDRILDIQGEPLSLGGGKVITEHDIHPGGWYLDCNRIPTSIAVEAGQADLFLSGFLGIDLRTRGLAVYRLLDAEVTFHRGLPGPGETIRYEIEIERFFTQGSTWLFRFRFDSKVGGEPLLTMRNGCAGFFSESELEQGRGIIHTELDKKKLKGKKPEDWVTPVTMRNEAYSDAQLALLRDGDLEGCFGPLFKELKVTKPLTIPGGQMKLVDRILHLDPQGGRFGSGSILAEADIHPDDWFLTCHFCDDNVMPGTLMYECCFHTLRIFLLRMGWIAEADSGVWEPVRGVRSQLKCRGQVIASTRKAAYEITIKELGYNPAPFAIADALMYADGKPVVEIINMSVQLSGATREGILRLWNDAQRQDIPDVERPALYDNESILAFAVGKPSEAFGEPYGIFDEKRVIARLPGPPYKFLDRITNLDAPPWKMQPGGTIEARYDIPPDEWYFSSYGDNTMPFAVLLEVALQPCGWLAAYMGSALTSDRDLSFRNLGGTAVLYEHIPGAAGTLVTKVKVTRVSSSGGMIIQHYEFQVSRGQSVVYRGTTYFGFFSKEALAQQVGMREVSIYRPSPEEMDQGRAFEYPQGSPFPDPMMRMMDRVELLVPDGGPAGLGFIRGSMDVDPGAWYFKAHFFQDPVIPGSLGIESYLQLLRVMACEKWRRDITAKPLFHSPLPGYQHDWVYRGQVLPADTTVSVDAWITSLDDAHHVLRGEGYLYLGKRVIYYMKDFTLSM